MKRNRLAMITGLAAAVLLSACGGTQSTTGSAASGPEAVTQEVAANTADSTEAAGGAYDLCYVATVEDEFLSELMNDMSAAAQKYGADIEIRHAGNDTTKAIQCIEQARSDGKDAVIVNMAYSTDASACVEAAGDMKLVFVNRVPESSEYSLLSENAVAVASDEKVAATFQGEFLRDYFLEKGQTDVRYLMLQGPLDLSHSKIRSDVPLELMREAGLNLIDAGTMQAEYSRGQAQKAMEKLLSSNPEFDCIISNNDAMALGAIQALKNAGIDPSSLPIVGIDATADAVQAIKDGELSMSVFQSAQEQAEAAVRIAMNMVDGKPAAEGTNCSVSEESAYLYYVPFELVTAENAAEY